METVRAAFLTRLDKIFVGLNANEEHGRDAEARWQHVARCIHQEETDKRDACC